MSVKYSVHVTPSAEKHLLELARYISQVLQAPQAGLGLLDQIDREIQSLSQFPLRFPRIRENPWHDIGIRKMPEKNYLVYYFVDEETATVHITAVINGRRDQLAQLSRLP